MNYYSKEKILDASSMVGSSSALWSSSATFNLNPLDFFEETADTGGGGVGGFSQGAGGIALIGGVITTVDRCSENPGDIIGSDGTRYWFNDNVPYTRIEKRATQNYNNLHSKKPIVANSAFISIDSCEEYNNALEILQGKNLEQICEDLEVLEKALEDVEGKQ